jgi:MoaA/NifB/PqqE/SkfB family radical SAM enzyme
MSCNAQQAHVIEHLPILILNPHSRCNCRCVMCDIWKVETAREIGAAELERHLADIETLGVRWVVFSGGEPLMHSDLFRLCSLLRGRGIRATILSSGLLLLKFARPIVAHLDDVIVSLDGPAGAHNHIRGVKRAFELLSAGVDAIHVLNPDFPVSGRCTVQRLNFHHLRATVETARQIGLRSISFLAADLTSTAFNRLQPWDDARQSGIGLDAEETALLEDEIEALIRDCSVDLASGFIQESPQKLRRIVHHFQAHNGLAQPESARCNAPWVSAVVEADGAVRPCFFHPPIGNISGRGLLEVLNSPEALHFRDRLDVAQNPVCQRCVCSLYVPAATDGYGHSS